MDVYVAHIKADTDHGDDTLHHVLGVYTSQALAKQAIESVVQGTVEWVGDDFICEYQALDADLFMDDERVHRVNIDRMILDKTGASADEYRELLEAT